MNQTILLKRRPKGKPALNDFQLLIDKTSIIYQVLLANF